VAGYDLVQEILENFKFSPNELHYLQSLPAFHKADPRFFEALRNLDLSDLQIWGMPEGELAFPRLPILQVRGPILKAQLLESALLNAVNFASLVATYSRRIRVAAGDRSLIEFGLRRAQGPNGAMTATRASYLGGFDGTSNVLAAMKFHIPAVGTMAHSFVQSFFEPLKSFEWRGEDITRLLEELKKEDGLETNDRELSAFFSYAQAIPDHVLLLVDTYDTLHSGVPNAIRIFKILRKFGHEPLGIRLDSGDLVYLSKETRKLLDEAGFHKTKIFASNELDEKIIASLQDQGAQIDSYGVGTRLVTAASDPALGGVYKLVELDGRPRMKISQQTAKLVIPGAKSVYRLLGSNGKMLLDLLTHQSEPAPKAGEEILAFHPSDPFKKTWVTPSAVLPLLVPLYKDGRWLETSDLTAKRQRSLEGMRALREDIVRMANPAPYKVSLSRKLKDLLDTLYNQERPAAKLQ
jgi:nicotinate phosphoribosyltransferase